ncbi:MAG: DNRLRE domain-containing protein [Chitinispirillaceae bacterium]|nr:DNRLRE domain-containing protein [Chitinispirillaceae bacterium]
MPADAAVTSANFEVYALRYIGGSQTGDYSVFKIIRAWIEEEATWENASNDQKWSKGGGDYESKAIAKVTSWPRSNGKTWVSYNVLATVQEFVKSPATNFGFMLVNTRMSQEMDVASSEYKTSEQRPKLTITYDYNGTTGIVPRAASAAAPKGVTVLSQRRGIHLLSSAGSSIVTVTVARPDGRCLYTGGIAPGGEKLLTGLNPGVYIITMRSKSRLRSTSVMIMP